MGWGQPVRIRHVTSGRYLGVTHDHNVVTIHRGKADENTTSFYLRMTKVGNSRTLRHLLGSNGRIKKVVLELISIYD